MPIAAPPSRRPRRAYLLALTLAASACAHSGGRPGLAEAGPAASVDAARPSAPAWWRGAGDPLLIRLIERGLDTRSPDCDIRALHEHQRAASAGTLGARLKRFFEPGAKAREEQRREDLQARAARTRVATAERIALAYLEARRLSDVRALRERLLAQYRDNAEIAEFRRQAGLVPAIDRAIAGTQAEVARAELGRTEGRVENALARLAKMTREDAALLATWIEEARHQPYPFAVAASGSAGEDREPGTLNEALEAARRSVADARLAYREGAGTLATLYVAEAAALSVEAALIEGRAAAAATEVRRESEARDQFWAVSDVERMALDPLLPGADDGGGCD